MADFLRRNRLLIYSFAFVIVSFQLMNLSIGNPQYPAYGAKVVDKIVSPFQKLYYEIFQSSKYYWEHYLWLINIESERDEYLARVKELEAQNSKLIEFENENTRLKTILNYTEQTNYKGILSTVIGRDPSNWVKTITIDKGSDAGFRNGLAVVDGNAVVGQIISTNSNTSRVLLVTDNSSAIDAILQNSRAQGTVEGMLETSKLKMRYVLKLKEFIPAVGERVIASGIDGVFPKGTVIGVVSKSESPANDLFQEIEIKPSIDISRLENVFVIIPQENMQSVIMPESNEVKIK